MKSLFNRLKGNHPSQPSKSTANANQQGNGPSSSSSSSSSLPPALPTKSISRPSSIVRSPTPLYSPNGHPLRPSSEDSIALASLSSLDQILAQEEESGNTGNGYGQNQANGGNRKVTFRSPAPTPIPTPSPGDQTSTPGPPHAGPSRPLVRPQPISRGSAPLPASRPPGVTARKSSLPPLPPIRSDASFSSRSQRLSVNSPILSSAMSPTPSDSSAMSSRSYLPPPNSWSEMAEEDLIANLGPKERTRQEVLWEIVSSEERYVQELLKLNETFSKALLPPSTNSPSLSLYDPIQSLSRTLSPSSSTMSPTSSSLHSRDESFDYLPIAAKYSTTPLPPPSDPIPPAKTLPHPPPPPAASARMDAYQRLTNGRPGVSPAEAATRMNKKSSFATLSGKMRGHQSMPPPARSASAQATIAGPSSSASHTRMSYQPNKLFKDPRSASSSSASLGLSSQIDLPEDLEKVLKVLSGGILEGHIKLAAALRKRYENQYPLVRSLADVFNAHSYILREYATYVLHLEKALEQVDEVLSLALQPSSKRHSRQLETTTSGRLGKLLLSLEELAVERGESGLVISLSKPFQRLLKYPLLFQNLLFNTDPSLREYEATLAMVDEVELIVRTIEDEKADWEEREKTRDVWARIEGLEKEKMLVTPKPNRMLINEAQLPSENAPGHDVSQRQKKSFRRLSDILKGHESADLWVVRFSDVSLLCERTGMTSLPTSSTLKRSPDSEPDLSSRAKRSSRRATSVKPRNLYRLVKVHEWHLKPKTESTDALVLMEDISRARHTTSVAEEASATPRKPTVSPSKAAQRSLPSPTKTPTKIPLKTNDGPSSNRTIRPKAKSGASDTDTLVSDRMSVMSFAFKGGDQIRPVRGLRPKSHQPALPTPSSPTRNANRSTIRHPHASTATAPTASSLQRRSSQGHMSGSAANAKFAHRLRATAPEVTDGDITVRATSRSRQSLPAAMVLNSGLKPTEVQIMGRNPLSTNAGGALSPTDRGNTMMKSGSVRGGKLLEGLPKSVSHDKMRPGVKGSAPPSSVSARRLKPLDNKMGGPASPRKANSGIAGSGARPYGGKI